MNILVQCAGNSARSILLETRVNDLGAAGSRAYSAGSQPAGQIHPQSLRLLMAKGHQTQGLRSKSWDEFSGEGAIAMDVVITVCASAAGETCPIWPGAPVRTHWGVDDPAAAEEADWEQAFETAYALLERRAKAFVALAPTPLQPAELKAALDKIGHLQ